MESKPLKDGKESSEGKHTKGKAFARCLKKKITMI